jgi:diguanylate cyclase (GGDEF)-like protein
MNAEWSRARREGSSLSLLMMDIDQFKSYNDIYGHPQGDTLLQALGRVFESTVKRPTDMVARLGGEEFGVILPGTDLQGARKIAEKIRKNVKSTIVPFSDDIMTSATISIGAATIMPGGENVIDELVREADKMLYNAKRSGRDRICP